MTNLVGIFIPPLYLITLSYLLSSELYSKVESLFLLFQKQDYFKEKLDITAKEIPESAILKAKIAINFSPFPFEHWALVKPTKNYIFDTLEFLYNSVSKPQNWISMVTETGYNYYDYDSYNSEIGQKEFRNYANSFLIDFDDGFELSEKGLILAFGKDGLEQILQAEIIEYDETNVDSKVRNAILKWRNRELNLDVRREAIRELADVFEWLKKNSELEKVLNSKDESLLFNIANNFAIRHHNPQQQENYDKKIWYPWIFHFYLATYHASIRLLKKSGVK